MASRTYEVTQRRNPSVLRTRGKRVWTARVERWKDGEPRRPLNPNITQELIASIDRTLWLSWNYVTALPPVERYPAI